MGNMIAVNVLDPIDDLLEVESGLLLGEGSLDAVVEFALARQFHDHVDVIGGIEDFVEFDDIGVVDEFENPDFPLYLN